MWLGNMTGDPAAWGDWMACVQKALLPDTPEMREMLYNLVSHKQNHQGWDTSGSDWYAQILPDGKQLWANMWHGKVRYAGIRTVPRAFDPEKGLSSPSNP